MTVTESTRSGNPNLDYISLSYIAFGSVLRYSSCSDKIGVAQMPEIPALLNYRIGTFDRVSVPRSRTAAYYTAVEEK